MVRTKSTPNTPGKAPRRSPRLGGKKPSSPPSTPQRLHRRRAVRSSSLEAHSSAPSNSNSDSVSTPPQPPSSAPATTSEAPEPRRRSRRLPSASPAPVLLVTSPPGHPDTPSPTRSPTRRSKASPMPKYIRWSPSPKPKSASKDGGKRVSPGDMVTTDPKTTITDDNDCAGLSSQAVSSITADGIPSTLIAHSAEAASPSSSKAASFPTRPISPSPRAAHAAQAAHSPFFRKTAPPAPRKRRVTSPIAQKASNNLFQRIKRRIAVIDKRTLIAAGGVSVLVVGAAYAPTILPQMHRYLNSTQISGHGPRFKAAILKTVTAYSPVFPVFPLRGQFLGIEQLGIEQAASAGVQ